MKEYRDARKAMALAQEEERKARMNASGANTQFGASRNNGQGANRPGLLRAAVLNSAWDAGN